jgi:membrane protease YdiL (CAAX protease family)
MKIPEKIKLTLKAWPVITIIVVTACFFTTQIGLLLGIEFPVQNQIHVVKSTLQNAFANSVYFWSAAFIVLQVLLIMPVIEEAVFRWFLWRLPQPKRVHVQAVISAAIFSAAHYITNPFPDNAFVALFLFGLAQCWIYRKTESLACCMLNHSLFNLTNLILLFVIPEHV